MRKFRSERGGFRWEEVEVQAYGPPPPRAGGELGDPAAATRQVLFGPEAGLACELRYFELAPGGATRLERHRHVHAVVILRGEGAVLVANEVRAVRPHDLVHVPPRAWHQLRASPQAPLGFLCLVNRERDAGEAPDVEQLAELRRDPVVDAFLRGELPRPVAR